MLPRLRTLVRSRCSSVGGSSASTGFGSASTSSWAGFEQRVEHLARNDLSVGSGCDCLRAVAGAVRWPAAISSRAWLDLAQGQLGQQQVVADLDRSASASQARGNSPSAWASCCSRQRQQAHLQQDVGIGLLILRRRFALRWSCPAACRPSPACTGRSGPVARLGCLLQHLGGGLVARRWRRRLARRRDDLMHGDFDGDGLGGMLVPDSGARWRVGMVFTDLPFFYLVFSVLLVEQAAVRP